MIIVRPPVFVRAFYKDLTWNSGEKKNIIHLTFDDGPIPEVTPRVLDLLKSYNAKATFFCIGRNANDNPEIFQRLISEGHSIGNHSYNHLNGWQTDNKTYFENIEQCQQLVQSKLFRPPYGRIKRSQINVLKLKYKIIMWDVLSWDFNQGLSAQQCTNYVLTNVKPGSIVVFHDSIKAEERMMPALEKTLEKFSGDGWIFEGL